MKIYSGNGIKSPLFIDSNPVLADTIDELDLTSTATIEAWLTKYSGTYSRNSEMNVFDYQSVLQTSTNGVAPIYGGRLSGGDWYNTDTAGTAITGTMGLALHPSVTNNIPDYRTFSTWNAVSANVTKDQIGVDGAANSASILEDDNAGGYEEVRKDFTIIDDSNHQSVAFIIKKDSDTTRYPGLYFTLNGGVQRLQNNIFNTQGGVVTTELENDGEYNVFDLGTFWFVTIAIQNNSSGNTAAAGRIYPAVSTDGTNLVTSATGSVISDWAQQCNYRRCPVHLVEGGSTLAAQSFSFANTNLISATEGSIYIEFQALPDYSAFINDTVLLGNGDCEIRAEALTDGISFYDGTNNTNGSVGTPSGVVKAVVVWSGTSVSITTTNGTTTGTYAGNFGNATVYIGRNAGGSIFPGIETNVKFYSAALSQTDAETLIV